MKATKLFKLFAVRSSAQLSVAFIALTLLLRKDVNAESNEASRRCHWCGPLAEQIHRSRRAPPCEAADFDTQVTTCEPGYQYCAVVATAPPYVESRYCVKLYQDECYTLYCNTTNSWKMTCPCRGDFCNGPNADREKEAFAALMRVTSKTTPATVKKRPTKVTPNIIKRDVNEVIDSDTTDIPTSSSDQEINDASNESANTVEVSNSTPSIKPTESDEATDAESNESSTNEPPTLITLEQNEIAMADQPMEDVEINKNVIEYNDIKSDNDSKSKDEPTVASVPEVEIQLSNNNTKSDSNDCESKPKDEPTAASIPEVDKQTLNNNVKDDSDDCESLPTNEPTVASVPEVENQLSNENKKDPLDEGIKTNNQDTNAIKPSEQLPTAEALQQNTTPIVNEDKATEHITTEGTFSTSTITLNEATPSPTQKSKSEMITQNFSFLLTCLVSYLLL